MRQLLFLALALVFLVTPGAGARRPSIDDVVDGARQKMRRRSPPVARPAEVAEVAAPHVSPAMAAAGTLILLTAVTMAFTGLVLELGLDFRRPRRVRIRFKPV